MASTLSRADLSRTVVEDRLKTIAAQLIAAHRRRDHGLVVPYARQAGLVVEGQSPQSLFMKTIQVFHPDRLSLVWQRVELARSGNDTEALDGLCRLLTVHPETARAVDFEEEEEEYGFDEEDFGYDIHEGSWDEDEDEDGDWDPDEGTFYSAVKRAMFGNLDLYPDAADLAKLGGELDLSDHELHDLEGIEHCVALTALNLSRNHIDNIYPLKDLVRLEFLDLAENHLEDADALGGLVRLSELDLSANDIEDVAFLDRLPRLKYVDLSGNPVRSRTVLERLESRGVIVIF